MKKLSAASTVLLVILSQVTLTQTQPLETVSNDPASIPARGGQVDWGLALSGGGMRAASFSIGVLKALYDKTADGEPLLNRIDVISSVSGGGFANYWLLTSYDAAQQLRFGQAMLADEVFLKELCNLKETSHMVPKSAAFRVFTSRDKAFQYYKDRIRGSFGKTRRSDEMLTVFRGNDLPYYVLGTAREKGKSSRLFVEITPEYIGNPALGFAKWDVPQRMALRLLDGIAISGAALEFKLKRTIGPYSELNNGKEFDLADGGFVDNLAAIPLIRRKIKNIIIVDSEEDANYKFGQYKKLKELLEKEFDITLEVDAIDRFLKNRKGPFVEGPVNIGSTKNKKTGDRISTIHYIKLARPASILRSDAVSDGRYSNGNRLAQIRDNAIKCPNCPCACADAPPSAGTTDLFFYLVNKFDREREERSMKLWRFPQLLTADESPEPETMEALIGLGYLSGLALDPSQP